jgi:hypothetical protein
MQFFKFLFICLNAIFCAALLQSRLDGTEQPEGFGETVGINSTTALAVVAKTLPNAVLRQGYVESIEATGGVQPYRFSLLGTAPAGMNLEINGRLFWTPSNIGTVSLTVRVVDQAGGSAERTFSLVVVNGPLGTQFAAQRIIVGRPFSYAADTFGGTPPYVHTVTESSNLPAGMTLAPLEFCPALPQGWEHGHSCIGCRIPVRLHRALFERRILK